MALQEGLSFQSTPGSSCRDGLAAFVISNLFLKNTKIVLFSCFIIWFLFSFFCDPEAKASVLPAESTFSITELNHVPESVILKLLQKTDWAFTEMIEIQHLSYLFFTSQQYLLSWSVSHCGTHYWWAPWSNNIICWLQCADCAIREPEGRRVCRGGTMAPSIAFSLSFYSWFYIARNMICWRKMSSFLHRAENPITVFDPISQTKSLSLCGLLRELKFYLFLLFSCLLFHSTSSSFHHS